MATTVMKTQNTLSKTQPSQRERDPDDYIKVVEEDEKYATFSALDEKTEKVESAAPIQRSIRRPVNQLQKVSDWHGVSQALLEDEVFYHGYMARSEAERLLKKRGEFLLRKAEVRKRESIQILARYHMAHKEPVYDDVILESYFQRDDMQLYHEQITLGEKLGEGAFGEVYKGTLTVGLFTKPIEVAVKTLKPGSLNSDDRLAFLREANVMLKLRHKYVIRLYGVATQKEPIMIAMELASGGTLLSKLRKGTTDIKQKQKYCYQVLKGMAYLEEQQVMHRDLAARNCLIGSNDSCKISDFGLSLFGHTHKERQHVKVPVRWLAPEALAKGMYSNKSDVWSFGVLMFEVFSDGDVPYRSITKLPEVRRKVVLENLRLTPPPGMPKEDAALMAKCFESDPVQRPSFEMLEREPHPQSKYSSMSDDVNALMHLQCIHQRRDFYLYLSVARQRMLLSTARKLLCRLLDKYRPLFEVGTLKKVMRYLFGEKPGATHKGTQISAA